MKIYVSLPCLIFICLGIIGLDYLIGRNIYRHVRANSFSTTTGTLTSSKVTYSDSGSSRWGPSYTVDISYTYEVEGKTYRGTKYNYDKILFSNSAKADAAARLYFVGALTTVYYDPTQPDDSVLSPGISGSDLLLLLLMTPFNLFCLGMVSALALSQWQNNHPPEAGGVKWRMDRAHIRVRLAEYSPIVLGLAAIGFASFASTCVIGFTYGGVPPRSIMVAGWLIVFGVGLGVALWQWWKQAGGVTDLVIDQAADTVELPATADRKQRETIVMTELLGVEAVPVASLGSKGSQLSSIFVILRRRNGSAEILRKWDNYNKARAEEFAAWLRIKLNLPGRVT